MSAKTCPKCGLFNSPEALRCDCGFDFSSGTVKSSYAAAAEANREKRPWFDELTTGDYLLAGFLPVIALVIALVRVRKQQRSGTVLAAVTVTWFAVLFILGFLFGTLR
jgi:hypothetical protein